MTAGNYGRELRLGLPNPGPESETQPGASTQCPVSVLVIPRPGAMWRKCKASRRSRAKPDTACCRLERRYGDRRLQDLAPPDATRGLLQRCADVGWANDGWPRPEGHVFATPSPRETAQRGNAGVRPDSYVAERTA
jgi:hypothetical protein